MRWWNANSSNSCVMVRCQKWNSTKQQPQQHQTHNIGWHVWTVLLLINIQHSAQFVSIQFNSKWIIFKHIVIDMDNFSIDFNKQFNWSLENLFLLLYCILSEPKLQSTVQVFRMFNASYRTNMCFYANKMKSSRNIQYLGIWIVTGYSGKSVEQYHFDVR